MKEKYFTIEMQTLDPIPYFNETLSETLCWDSECHRYFYRIKCFFKDNDKVHKSNSIINLQETIQVLNDIKPFVMSTSIIETITEQLKNLNEEEFDAYYAYGELPKNW